MSDLIKWMYENYIRPQIENQPKDFGETMMFDLLNNELAPQMQQHLQDALAYYATQGFRLGVRTGVTLESDLR